MQKPLRIFLCSTFADLSGEREAVLETIQVLQQQHRSMEFFGARTGLPLETCLAEVRTSDLLVVIVGHSYGSLVPRQNLSYSQAEYEEGRRLGKQCLVYQRDDNVPILPKHMETNSKKLRLLKNWKNVLSQAHTVAAFQDGQGLAKRVLADLLRILSERSKNEAEDLVDEFDKRRSAIVQSAESAGLQRRVIIALAQKLRPDNRLDLEQALVELERAVEIALDVIAKGERGSNEGDFVDAVLAEVAEKTRNNDLNGAAKALEDALAEVDRREVEQREAASRQRIIFLEAAVEQHTLRRDAPAVAACLERLADPDRKSDRPAWLPQFREMYHQCLNDGETKEIYFSFLVALECGRTMGATARDPHETGISDYLIGVALLKIGSRDSGKARLEESVTAYRAALAQWTREQAPGRKGVTLNAIGNALVLIGGREGGTARLVEAVSAYRAALEVRSRESDPQNWALTQNNLGYALQSLGERESGIVRLEEAAAAYRAALQELTRERAPLQWAMTQTNIGNVLSDLAVRENDTARLEEAVAVYRAALEERTRELSPLAWASTQDFLGTALQRLGERETGTTRLEEAVAVYRSALQERRRELMPLQWAATQNILGTTLMALGEGHDGAARLEEAVTSFRAALDEWTRERVPLHWASAQSNLGEALLAIGEREKGIARLNEAVSALRAAQEEWTKERVPQSWQMAQDNLLKAIALIKDRKQGSLPPKPLPNSKV